MSTETAIGQVRTIPRTQRLALTATLTALGVVLGTLSVPIGPARVAPFQHFINVLAGVLVGPWYALLTAFAISVLRNALGTGTFLAFPGSMFGALFVGLAYHYVRRTDVAAFVEPIGTSIVGALVGYALIAPLQAKTLLLGFVAANPPAYPPYLAGLGGPVAMVVLFAISDIPGCILGFFALRALRRAGVAF
ncbi:MAG: energy coupling factor transporter S component ThiW [Chloroflexota bacterium]|nr:energy coupling factor transporter S component ThiW [Chloroflexota bacterium]MDE3100918.1 energy coupling factor transporter S component ThiW [Chloroflexota bacterium]